MRGGKLKYRNKYTGSEIEVNSIVKGGGWEPVPEPVKVPEVKAPEKPKKTTKTRKGKK